MPIYAYQCPVCDARFELLRPSVLRDEPARCEACGHEDAGRSMDSYASAVQGSSTRDSAGSSSCGGRGGFT